MLVLENGSTRMVNETVEVIGTVSDGRGGRQEVRLVGWESNGSKYITLHGRHICRDYSARGGRTRAIAKAKAVYADPSNKAQWLV